MFKRMVCFITLIVSDIASLFSALYLAYLIRKEVLIYIYSRFRVIETPPFIIVILRKMGTEALKRVEN